MTDYQPSLDDMRFLLNHVFSVPQLWQRLSPLNELIDTDTADAILGEAARLMSEVIHPINQPGDAQGCIWESESVQAPQGYQEAYRAFVEGGWNSFVGDPEYGGMGMPKTLACCVDEMMQGASLAFGLLPMLTAGACLALHRHGSEELKQRYLPKMYEGVWSGAMDLTEPHAGTDLGLIRTKAIPNEDGSYSITGTKIFITWGEQDLTENIIHLVLAKLPDAPAGSKGISMFLVPKFLVDEEGNPGERNQVVCGSIEHKMGIHGSATCVMNYDGACGWLVGEPNKGLAAMFTMMNDERLAVGIQGLGVADLAYQQAAAYAKERIQGRNPAGAEQPDQAADNLLAHADVRRMLMTVRSTNEAARAFLLYIAQWLDVEHYSDDDNERQQAAGRVALLTPIAKGFITDLSFDNTVLAQQVLGGHGYIREWGLEQLVRDCRITQIYEGTNGVQAMDLLGRKILLDKGAALNDYLAEIDLFCQTANNNQLIAQLKTLRVDIEKITQSLISDAENDPHAVGSAAVHYMSILGYFSYLYMWAKMIDSLGAMDAEFAEAKEMTGNFYLKAVLPKIQAFITIINSGSQPVMAMNSDSF